MNYLSIIFLILLSGCTLPFPPMPNLDSSRFAVCHDMDTEKERQDCTMGVIDSTPASEKVCERFKPMEGYRMPTLRELQKMGRLHFHELSPALLAPEIAVGVFLPGLTYFEFGNYGDIYSADVYYIKGWSYILEHELEHVAGTCVESGGDFGILTPGYTDAQKEIMYRENVKHWYETSRYKTEYPTWHDR